MLWFVAIKLGSEPCKSIEVNIVGETTTGFLHKNDIILKLKEKQNILGEPIEDVDIAKLEDLLMEFSAVRNAEIYHDLDGTLFIDVYQKSPLVRVLLNDGHSFYIDEDGEYMKLSDKYSARVIVASGNIDAGAMGKDSITMLNFKNQQTGVLTELYQFVDYINKHKFWKAQFEQIYITDKNQIELIPKIGSHFIEFGTFDDFEKKLRNLEALYKEGFKRLGWNKYSTICLKYEGQVVCKVK